MKILSVFGTRPEAIKMAPVVRELDRLGPRSGLRSVVCVTAQHRQMLDQVLHVFQIRPDVDLNLMRERQTLSESTSRAVSAIAATLESERPDLVLVQGDTTTAMAAALAAFYEKIPVGHVEAGLRTRNRFSPFPEEVNRRIVGHLADYHFAPTRQAAANLAAEGVPLENIFQTGNTVIDALLWVGGKEPSDEARQLLDKLGTENTKSGNGHGSLQFDPRFSHRSALGRKTILVTAHRRESFGAPIENICRALREIVHRNLDVQVVYPLHMNPAAREPALRLLHSHPRIHLTDPLPYEPLVHLLKRVYLVLTDSGGIQEEAPAFGKPVLVLREDTERPEGVAAGCAKIVGTDSERILRETELLLHDSSEYERMAHCENPYGDGAAAKRILNIILSRKEALAAGRARASASPVSEELQIASVVPCSSRKTLRVIESLSK
jgi:UDP-N-acetylglucosamine 2-epimerase